MPDRQISTDIPGHNQRYCSKEEEKVKRFKSVEKEEAQRSDHIFLTRQKQYILKRNNILNFF